MEHRRREAEEELAVGDRRVSEFRKALLLVFPFFLKGAILNSNSVQGCVYLHAVDAHQDERRGDVSSEQG